MRFDFLPTQSRPLSQRQSAGCFVCHQHSILSLGSCILPSTEVRPTLRPRIGCLLWSLWAFVKAVTVRSPKEHVPANPGFSAAPVFTLLLTVPCHSPQSRPGFLALTHQSTSNPSPQSTLHIWDSGFHCIAGSCPFAGLHTLASVPQP